VERLIGDDLAEFDSRLQRHWISLGQRVGDSAGQVLFSPRGGGILVAGPSASGKSTAVAGILEQLLAHQYQFCLLDPEGDYDDFSGALSFGTARERPDAKVVLRALESPEQSAIVNLLGVPIDDRPGFFGSLLSSIQELRLRSARPHWLVIDEAHHLLPSSWSPMTPTVSHVLESAILITVHPEHVAKAALDHVSAVVAIGNEALKTIGAFSSVIKTAPPKDGDVALETGEALVWLRTSEEPPVHVKTARSAQERRRHVRLYAEGELSEQQSFYFRGPESKLNLRAQNLKTFIQIAEGVDDATWMYHLRRGEYSAWFRSVIKDNELAELTEDIEHDAHSSPQGSRERVKKAIGERYTAPA
jgi:energy-coupling factor transporter ATP-binding protein EcfA2